MFFFNKRKHVPRDIVVMYESLRRFHDIWTQTLQYSSRDFAPKFYVDYRRQVWVTYDKSELYTHCPIYKFHPHVPHKESVMHYFDFTNHTILKFKGDYENLVPSMFDSIPKEVFYRPNFGIITKRKFLKLLAQEMERHYNDNRNVI